MERKSQRQDVFQQLVVILQISGDGWSELLEPKVELLAPTIHKSSSAAHNRAYLPGSFVNFASEPKACQLVWKSLQCTAQKDSFRFAEGCMFGRLVPAKSEAILGKPTSEFVLKSTLQAEGFVRSQFFVLSYWCCQDVLGRLSKCSKISPRCKGRGFCRPPQ